MKKILLNTVQSFIDLVYPPCCIACRQGLVDSKAILCPSCINLMDVLDPSSHCSRCFTEISAQKYKICMHCLKKSDFPFDGLAAVFDYAGPAACLVRQFKYADKPYLAKGLAAYMVMQFMRLEWELPDLIIPVPLSLGHWLMRGYNQSQLLAHEMGKLLQCQVREVLWRNTGDYSQAGLSKKQRMQLQGNRFILQHENLIHDKSILLVDDVMTTGTTLKHCASTLISGSPIRIYGLTVCKSLD